MSVLSEEILSAGGVLRVDVHGADGMDHVLQNTNFLGYRLGDVALRSEIQKDRPDVVWDKAASTKSIVYENDQLLMSGAWEQGELNKIMVSMTASRMDIAGIHPFHSSSVRFKDRSILFVGGENNHGKSMSQIEGCARGALLISTETTVTDDDGLVIAGSKSVYVGTRSKGTERADLPDQDEGVALFFDQEPEFVPYEGEAPIDIAIMPGMDGHFATQVVQMGQFEKEYQTFHSLMGYFGLNQLLAPGGHIMPVVDTQERREKRGKFTHRFVTDIPYYMVRAKTPQILWDEVEKILAKEKLV